MQSSTLAFAGDYEGAVAISEKCLATAERLGVKFLIHFAWDIIALAALFHGRFAEAGQAAERCLSSMTGNVRIETAMRCTLGLACLKEGDIERADCEMTRAAEIARDTTMLSTALAFLASLRLAQGRAEEALDNAEKAVAHEKTVPAFEPFAGFPSMVAAQVLLALGRNDEAKSMVESGLAVVARAIQPYPPERRARFLARPLGPAELMALGAEMGLALPS